MFRPALFKAIKYLKNQASLARAIGLSSTAVSNYVNTINRLPLERAFQISAATNSSVSVFELIPERPWVEKFIQGNLYKPQKVNASLIKHKQPKQEDIKALTDNIQSYGLHRPIAITQKNELIYGNNRLLAYKALNYKYIPALVINLESFLKAEKHVYGLISHCTEDERATIGKLLEPLVSAWKNTTHVTPLTKHKKLLFHLRPDIDFLNSSAEHIAAKLLQFDSTSNYRKLKEKITL